MVKTALVEQSFFGILQSLVTFLILMVKKVSFESLMNIGCDSSHTNNNLILVLVFGKNAKKNFFFRHPVDEYNY